MLLKMKQIYLKHELRKILHPVNVCMNRNERKTEKRRNRKTSERLKINRVIAKSYK